jgi:citrate lyase subunit alpha/citrate CoA-transferase
LTASGDPEGIVSGTVRFTKDPIYLAHRRVRLKVIENSACRRTAFPSRRGGRHIPRGGEISEDTMMKRKSRQLRDGRITGIKVDMLESGCFGA